ncbi:MAG: hypothetical protein QM769_02450 [Pseudoxanthomonas sp.]
MNLPLHYGFIGALEAAAIAFAIGLLMYVLWRGLSRAFKFSDAHAIGWACASATVIAAGIDAWHLFYLNVVKLESPLYARLALQGIHDPDSLGLRVVLEAIGAWCGVLAAWAGLHRRSAATPSLPATDTHGNNG